MSTQIENSIIVGVPVRTAYDQWTQFEDFPLFMDDVENIEQVDPETLHWKTKMRGIEREFVAHVTEQTPDQRIAWATEEGPKHAGVVTFHKIDEDQTKVMLQMDFEPEGLAESYADAVGLIERRVESDLENFKEFIEKRGKATGSWRGTVSAS